ncbi:hypothetical protein BDP27DRAFT_1370089 [Rhodocollybia butyracea]|uniref:Thioester reductase (TE) domain-containing protein n=1 Tax=Rhodocollybia butyracea TaxID=206335 RepID=A0A9P5TYX8_9AGAR|nr:hypothetical protein BDP27DRAFT_1370089 [Rhodocollybia butyracea]
MTRGNTLSLEIKLRFDGSPQGDGTYEAQFLTSEKHHIAVENLPDIPGYSTSDLFEPHPTIPHLWKIYPLGLRDLSMFGRERDLAGILLEPAPAYDIDVGNDAELSKFRNLICLFPEFGKGTVARQAALTLYDAEIDNLHGLDSDSTKTHEEAMEEMIAKYSKGLEAKLPVPIADIDPKQQFVLLTGSTGNLGAQILQSLLQNESDKALDISLLSSPKLVFLDGETSREDLGLLQDTLAELRRNLTMIIHTAWRLDFNLSLGSFESHVKSSRMLIDLARSSDHSSSIRFLFTSSIASTQSWDTTRGLYPEHVVMDAKYAVGAGYGESKYVAERILVKSGLQATSFRIGQITGANAPNGAWATTDWVPIIVKTSLSLGFFPEAFGVVSWIPMDAVCSALLDVGFSHDPPITVNVVHPQPVTWTSVMQSIRNAFIKEKGLPCDAFPLIPYSDWVAAVEKHSTNLTETDAQKMARCSAHASFGQPAIKLLPFYRNQANIDEGLGKSNATAMESVGLTPLSTDNVERLSPSLKTLKPLDDTIVHKWVKYWINSGF